MSWDLELLRDELRNRVNPAMDRSEQKEFTDYILARGDTVQDLINQVYADLYQNFLEDRENGDW